MVTFPAEWKDHTATWFAWPWAEELWGEDLMGAQKEFTALVKQVSQSEPVRLLVANEKAEADAQRSFEGFENNISYWQIPYGDIWLRDIGCIFTRDTTIPEKLLSQVFRFNGWGAKYILSGDQECALEMARASRNAMVLHDFILEGGSIENDGNGVCLTTEECLLNPNRNPQMQKADIEKELKRIFHFEKVVWLKKGLKFDHTDGHIDNIARFLAPGKIVCMQALDSKDPQKKILDEIYTELKTALPDFEIIRIPAPGPYVKDAEGHLLPASYLNFIFTKSEVIVPTYGTPHDLDALEALSKHTQKMGRKVVGLPSNKILLGGGSFHCISQQEPL